MKSCLGRSAPASGESGAWPAVVVPYRAASAALGAHEAAVPLGYVEAEWSVQDLRPDEREGELVLAESALPAADELA